MTVQWWLTTQIADSFPSFSNSQWRIASDGLFTTSLATHDLTGLIDCIIDLIQSTPEMEFVSFTRDKAVIVNLSPQGWLRSFEQVLAIAPATDNPVIAPAETIESVTKKYMSYRSENCALDSECLASCSMREDTSNPVYLLWYAFSYARRYLVNFPQLSVCSQFHHDHEQINYAQIPQRLKAAMAIFPQVCHAPVNFRCHYAESLAAQVLRYLPQHMKFPSREPAMVAQLVAHILDAVLSEAKLRPAMLI